jgi:hypothetical protein
VKVLIVSFRVPPFNSPGAVRVLGTASELLRLGFDVRILGAANQGLPPTLDPGELGSRITHVPWWDVNAPLNWLAGGRQHALRIGDVALTPTIAGRALLGVKQIYQSFLHVPDGQVGWISSAIRQGTQSADEWKPDVVIGSALPASSLYAARGIARKLRVPWIAEFRDLWTDNHYYSLPRWRRALDRLLEHDLLASTSGIVTISGGLAEALRARSSKPVEVILNGIDDAVIRSRSNATNTEMPLLIVHTGQLIPGKRDPMPVLQALTLLGESAKDVDLRFFGRRLEVVTEELRRFPSQATVSVNEPVSRDRALAIQNAADVLLLLLWNHPSESGVVTSKLFEYLASGHPILLVGPSDGEAARIVRESRTGFIAHDAHGIASVFRELIEKKKNGGIPRHSVEQVLPYRRSKQVERLALFFCQLVKANSPTIL